MYNVTIPRGLEGRCATTDLCSVPVSDFKKMNTRPVSMLSVLPFFGLSENDEWVMCSG